MSSTDQPVVLVVEDDPELRTLYVDWLTDHYRVRAASKGAEALEKLDDSVDVLLLDRRMPGLSGDDLLAKIDRRSLACRVAMVTAVDPDVEIVEMAFDDYLVKPVSAPDLYDTVEQLLARNTYDSALQEYFSLVSKKAVLETEHGTQTLAASTEYERMEERIDELQTETAHIRDGLTEHEFEQVLKDLTEPTECTQ